MEDNTYKRPFIAVIAAYALASASLLYFGTVFSDEGLLYVWGQRLIDGDLPYTDFFLQMAPGTFYIQAALMKVFGMSIIAGRIFKQVEGLIAGILVYLIVVRAFGDRYPAVSAAGRRAGLIAMIISLAWSGALHIRYHWYTMDAGIMILVGVYFFVRFIESEKLAMLFLSGLGFGASVLFKQNMGIFAALAGMGLCVVHGVMGQKIGRKIELLKRLPVFALASAVPTAIYLAYYSWAGGDINELYLQTMVYPRTVYGYASPIELFIFPFEVFLLLYVEDPGYYPVVLLLAGSFALMFVRRGPGYLRAVGALLFVGVMILNPGVFARFTIWTLNFFIFCACIAFFSFKFYKNRSDTRAFAGLSLSVFAFLNLYGGLTGGSGLGRFAETMTGSFYIYGVLVYMIEGSETVKALWNRISYWPEKAVVNASVAAYVLLGLMMVVQNVSFSPGLDHPLYRLRRFMSVEGARGIAGEPQYVGETEAVIRYAKGVLSCCPEKEIFVFPLNCMLYPLIGAKNPTVFDTQQSIPFVPEFIPDLIAQLDTSRPKLIIIQKRATPVAGLLDEEKVWVNQEVVGAVRDFVGANYIKLYDTGMHYEVYGISEDRKKCGKPCCPKGT